MFHFQHMKHLLFKKNMDLQIKHLRLSLKIFLPMDYVQYLLFLQF
jgi:hypothetical protein